ncbi:MAG: GNAT family N-acetyltransferase [Patescibacteria group bacterium]
MSFDITRRVLTEDEAHLLSEETRKSHHIGFISSLLWKTFPHVWVATVDGVFVGVCVAFPLKAWVKFGPLVVFEKFQGKGYGRRLLTHAVNQYQHANLFVGSSHPKVHTIIESLGFEEEASIFRVPFEVQRYLIRYILMRTSYAYLVDALRKKLLFRRGKYRYFLKR